MPDRYQKNYSYPFFKNPLKQLEEQKISNTFPQTPLSSPSCCIYKRVCLVPVTPWIQTSIFPKVQISSASAHQLLRHVAEGYSTSWCFHRQGSRSSLGNKVLWPCISPGAATSNPVYTAPLQEGIVTLKTSKCLKGFSFRLSCHEVSSRAPDLLFHQKIREGKFVGDQTNMNTLEETVGKAGEIVGLNKSSVRISTKLGGLFSPRSSHPADPKNPA